MDHDRLPDFDRLDGRGAIDMNDTIMEQTFRISAAEWQPNAIEIATAGLAGYFKSCTATMEILETHQRVYSRILDCSVKLGDGSQHRVMVKIYEPIGSGTRESLEKLVTDDFEITLKLNRVFQWNPRFQVPTPLFHSPEGRLIVTSHMPGTQLQEKLVARAGWFPDRATLRDLEVNCRSCGEWLSAFQNATLDQLTGGLDLQRMRAMIAQRLQWLVEAAGIPVGIRERDQILGHFDREVNALEPGDLTVSSIHGDFFPGNVLVDEDRVTGLDFAMCRIGSTWTDPSYFMFQLETLAYKPKFRRATIRRLQQAFLYGYNPTLREDHYFTSRPIVRIHFILHNVMRLAGMLSARSRLSWKGRLHNAAVAVAVTRRLMGIAREH